MVLNNSTQKLLNKDEEIKEVKFTELNLPKIGSEWYTPPEVVRKSNYEISPPFDIWTLGCVIIEMLTGVEPWSEFQGDVKAILKNLKITTKHPGFPQKLSENCMDFLENCLYIDPNKRMTASELLEHPFLSMTEKEVKESLEASNFISFFSILASQKSLSDYGKFCN